MKRELDEQLCHKYPSLYRDRNGDMRKTLMCWGFECGDGWYTLIDVMSELISKHAPEAYAEQIKEKFGSLRFYHQCGDNYTFGVEMAGDSLSQTVCEECGAPALLNNDEGCWFTRCVEHTSNYVVSDNLQTDISSVAGLGLGQAWSRLVVMLLNSAEWHTKKNGMPEAAFQISKINGRLDIKCSGGNEMTVGMVDLIAGYANRIDEHSGLINTPIN
ncbi:MAG: hypothetical protein ACXV7J_06610 [Methylomonas sp.]